MMPAYVWAPLWLIAVTTSLALALGILIGWGVTELSIREEDHHE